MKLAVSDLELDIGGARILSGISLAVEDQSSLGVVGESGSGKTLFARTLMGLLPPESAVRGAYTLDGSPVPLDGKGWGNIRGRLLGLVMQDPFSSLDPTRKCGPQILAALTGKQAKQFDLKRALAEVGLDEDAARKYPFELSGGMRQRIGIAAALAGGPRLLIADEATTALDGITQKEILDLIERLRRARGMSLILISHDLEVVRKHTDYTAVFHRGRIVEFGATGEIFSNPRSSYTRLLLDARNFTRSGAGGGAGSPPPLLAVHRLSKSYGKRLALDQVDINVYEGECVGIVGESGCGKTTLARCIIGLTRSDSGRIVFSPPETRPQRIAPFNAQMVFQDPYSSLNPALSVKRILTEALFAGGRPPEEAPDLLELVELPAEFLSRRPARLSGGQRQRVAIARALAPRPRLLLCDESVSALDAAVQTQILRTLSRLRETRRLSILFITHDLAVVRHIADRIYVMRDARVVEEGSAAAIFGNPGHPYTKTLLAATAQADNRPGG
ncbi:MAG: ABC transporter ATP-binding protein [Treponema sp.]|jgi:peptide/nickel transport system ATP-binding protein|nr:ABC transporter ATP-binding protein [Treponema sp.]